MALDRTCADDRRIAQRLKLGQSGALADDQDAGAAVLAGMPRRFEQCVEVMSRLQAPHEPDDEVAVEPVVGAHLLA